jgi:hypothetical protein
MAFFVAYGRYWSGRQEVRQPLGFLYLWDFEVEPTGGLARLSLGDLAFGMGGAASCFRAPQGRARPRFSLGARSRFKPSLKAPNFRWGTAWKNLEPTGGLEPPTC